MVQDAPPNIEYQLRVNTRGCGFVTEGHMMIQRIETYVRGSGECAITTTWPSTDSEPPISHV